MVVPTSEARITRLRGVVFFTGAADAFVSDAEALMRKTPEMVNLCVRKEPEVGVPLPVSAGGGDAVGAYWVP